jgi:hypothetical protein
MLYQFLIINIFIKYQIIKYIQFTVFTLNFLTYKPTGPVSSNIYRLTINSTVPNLKTTLYKSCDDEEEEEEEDNDDMEYTEDAIDNMILEFSGD